MNKKDNRRVQMTKQLLKESLVELLEDEDLRKISIRALCERAEVNRSTFYKYYGSQYDLLKEIEEDFLTRIEKTLSDKERFVSVDEQLTSILSFLQNNLKLCKMLIRETADANFQKQLLGLPAILEQLTVKMKDYSEQELVYVLDFILYGGYNMIVRWINEDCQESPKQMMAIIMKLMGKLF